MECDTKEQVLSYDDHFVKQENTSEDDYELMLNGDQRLDGTTQFEQSSKTIKIESCANENELLCGEPSKEKLGELYPYVKVGLDGCSPSMQTAPIDDSYIVETKEEELEATHLPEDNNLVSHPYLGSMKDSGNDHENSQQKDLSRVEVEQNQFVCNYCSDVFFEEDELTNHKIDIHSMSNPLECVLCQKKFAHLKSKVRHLKIHLGEKQFKCKLCKKQFRQKSHLKTHMRTHTGEKPFVCHICDHTYKRKETLECHLLRHLGEKRYECKVCKMKYATRNSLQSHMLAHKGKKKFACRHRRKPQFNFVCLVCDKKFSSQSAVRSHGSKHKTKSFKCNKCGDTFKSVEVLVSHFLLHTKAKPYKCKFCNRGFSYSTHLKVHSLLHTGEKPYACSHCERRFTQKGHLRTHLLLHSGEKPIKCDFCPQSFRQMHHLKGHLAAHHQRGTEMFSDVTKVEEEFLG